MKLYSLPIIGPFLRNLDTDVKTVGLQKAMMRIVLRSKTNLIIHGKEGITEEILKKKPVIIVANHPYDSEEVALIAALPSRRNTYLIVSSHFLGVSSGLDKHLIPVYIWHHVTDGKPKKFFGKLLHTLHPTPIYSPEEEHRRNKQSIESATQLVKKGGVVIIFPGRRSTNGHWFSGVGHLIRGLGKNTDAYIVKTYIQGTSDMDYLRMLPNVGKFMRPIRITFAKPTKAATIFVNDGKKIASQLELEYNQWVKTFS